MKGNALMAQSGGPTAVINNTICGVAHECAMHPEIEGVYGAINGILGVLKENLIDLKREDPYIIQGLRSTPSAALGSCRYKLKETDYARIMDVFKAHNIRYFFYTGGNDSMDTANKIDKMAKERGYELKVIGAPKTIDNDLEMTDHCPGYGSVSRFNAIATRDAGRDTDAIYTSDTIKIIETMGRDTGWITAATALAKEGENDAPHLIYLPEKPFIVENFLNDVDQVYKKLGRAVITVCEGLKNENGEYLTASKSAIDMDKFGHAQLGGVADYLCKLIPANLKIKARFDKPGTIQRMSMACASKTDIEEAYRVGRVAVKSAVEGKSGYMVALARQNGPEYWCKTELVKLDEVANKVRKMPDSFINKEGNFVSQEFIDYVKPLIGEPLPEYVRLNGQKVQRVLAPY
ncbi:MAG: 6-phosphofructokinase [Candidatus Thermoplasmatota archaeon]|nr:6-phosphofructokinase [Candidatus Thermoplasmatota archaeon]